MSTELKNLSSCNKDDVPSGEKGIFGIVVSEWNREITDNLLRGAVDTLMEHGVDDKDIYIRHVPGSFELPFGASTLLEKKRFDAIICLGCVIQGDTRHFDFICQGVTQGITQLQIQWNMPIAFGILTVNDMQQALDRCGGRLGNKGDECAVDAIKMAKF